MDLVPYLTVNQIDTLLHGLALVAGGVAFGCGLYQYSRAQAWKRHEFVATEIRQFDAEPQARNAMLMIDWGTRDIELFPSHPDYPSRYSLITRPVLYTALTTHDKIGRPFTPAEAAIRDCFDSFFAGLDRFEQFIQAGLVSATEFKPYLAYWIRSICEDANPELRRILNEYVAFYHFEGVATLFGRYGRTFGKVDTVHSPASRHEIQDRYEEQVKVASESQNQPSNQRMES